MFTHRLIPWTIAGLLALLICLVPEAQAQEGPVMQDNSLSSYRLGAGDVLRIDVFGEENLSIEARLSDGGTISYPLLGEVRVENLTVGELERVITRRLKGPYLVDPKVSATIVEYRQFFINGEVKNPGGYPFQPGLTVRKAIALAGGFAERASRKKLYLINEGDPQQRSGRVEMDAPVQPGDIITVNQSFF